MNDAGEPTDGTQPPLDGSPPNVSLGDAAIASAIGRAAAQGRGPDRSPTLEQLLAAFGEGEATSEARERADAALTLAGVSVEPDIRTAAPGQRLALTAPGMAQSSSRNPVVTGLLALAALAVILGTAFAVSRGLSSDDNNGSALSDTTPFTIGTVPPTTTATTETTTPTTETTTAEEKDAEEAAAAKKRAAEKRAAEKRREQAAARRRVVVRVDAGTNGTFLCVEDGEGNELFNGTLLGKQKFEEREVRLNIGLATTRVTVNGKPVSLSGSPTGLVATPSGVKTLPLGQRPCA
jgi:hypothetical protein